MGWKRRLPILLFVALGVWLWKSGPFVRERELLWQLGARHVNARSVDVQLYDEAGELLKRETWNFVGSAPPSELIQKVPLKSGAYEARVFVQAEDGGTWSWTQTLDVPQEGPTVIRLDRAAQRR